MEDSMSLRRLSTVAARLLILAAAVLIVPACKKKEDPAPHVTKGLPGPDAPDVAHFPLMLLEFDKAIDGTTISSNIEIWTTDAFGVPNLKWGGTWIFHHLQNSHQIVVENTQAFTKDTEYAVVIFNGLKSASGHGINGGMALRFTVGDSGNANKPAFSAPVQDVGDGGAGGIKFDWTQATEGGPVTGTYEFYMSPTSAAQDLFDNPPFFVSSNIATGTITGLTTGVTYYFRVIFRDSAGNIRVTSEFTGVAD
jgi:hypothetical protein